MISPRKSGREEAVWLWETRRGHGVETEHGEGRLWTLEGCAYFMEQPYAWSAAWSHCSHRRTKEQDWQRQPEVHIKSLSATVWTLIFAVLNFRGLRIFAFLAFLFSRMRVPQYYIIYIDYISVLICASHISHIYIYSEACLGCANSRSSSSQAMMPFSATLLCVLVPRRIILRIRPIPTSSVRSA